MGYTLSIDEINSFDYQKYIRDYFAPMMITREERDKREQAARDFREYLLTLFLLLGIQSEYLAVNWDVIEREMRSELETAALRYANNTPMLKAYIADKVSDFVRTTRENIDKGNYWTSDERATMEAVNEANEVFGIQDYQQAIESGMKYKTWRGMMDAKERKSHVKMEGKKIPIDDYFIMDKGILLFPGDTTNGEPEETNNCRCVCKYSKK